MVLSARRLLVFDGTDVPFDADATGTATAANAKVASPASTAMRNRVIRSSYEDVQKHSTLGTSRDGVNSHAAGPATEESIPLPALRELLTGGLSGQRARRSPTRPQRLEPDWTDVVGADRHAETLMPTGFE